MRVTYFEGLCLAALTPKKGEGGKPGPDVRTSLLTVKKALKAQLKPKKGKEWDLFVPALKDHVVAKSHF